MKIDNVALTAFWADTLDGGFVGIRSLADFFIYHCGRSVVFHLNFIPQSSGPRHLFMGFLFGFTVDATPGNRPGFQTRQRDFFTAILTDSIFAVFDVFQ